MFSLKYSYFKYNILYTPFVHHPRSSAAVDDNSSSSSPNLMKKSHRTSSPTPKAVDALPLPLYLTNAVFFTLFFSVAYYLVHRWCDKIRNSTPLDAVTLLEIAAIVSIIASFIYLRGFFGIDFVQSFIARASHDVWDLEDEADGGAGSDSRNHKYHQRPDFVIENPMPKLIVMRWWSWF